MNAKILEQLGQYFNEEFELVRHDLAGLEQLVKEKMQLLGQGLMQRLVDRQPNGYKGSSMACECGGSIRFVQHRPMLCGGLFPTNLILTNIASKVPQKSRLTAIAKRFRRQLADSRVFLKQILCNYLCLVRGRLNVDSLFIMDLSDLAKPYAKKMENLALVRDGDKGCLVTGYWCMEVYCLDKDGIIWPLILWPYSLKHTTVDILSWFRNGFLSYLQSRCRDIGRRVTDKLRYCREPKSFWFYRVLTGLREAFVSRARMSLAAWCRPPP